MAEALAKHYIDRFHLDVEAHGGGTRPGDRIDPGAAVMMDKCGIDISGQTTKPSDLAFAERADGIITIGCGAEDTCTAHLLTKVTDWDLEDAVGQTTDP